jgi:hypothetical protein
MKFKLMALAAVTTVMLSACSSYDSHVYHSHNVHYVHHTHVVHHVVHHTVVHHHY